MRVGDIHFLNSGDWVESLTAIVEHHDGRMELIHFEEFMPQCRVKSIERIRPSHPRILTFPEINVTKRRWERNQGQKP